MTERQIRFCREYVANGGDADAAYMAAGYKAKIGTNQRLAAKRLVSNEQMKEYIERLTKAAQGASLKGTVDVAKINEVADDMEFAETKAGQTWQKNEAWFSALIMRRNERLARLSEIARQQVEEEVIVRGEKVMRRASIKDAIRAMELIAKMEGELQEKREVQDDMVITVGMVGGEVEDAEVGSEDKPEDNQQSVSALPDGRNEDTDILWGE